ncbi:MAG: hypothetical protein KF805_07700 [Phycisphaeraceae bacterium]|nr:hypothetical protein [Phycisphaeraceae bacterium]
MQFLTQAQCDQWLQRAGHNPPSDGALRLLPADQRSNLENENPARLNAILRTEISKSVFDRAEPLLLVVHDYAHWPSNQNLLLYSLIRRHFFHAGTVEDTPGHLAEAHEMEFVLAIAFLCVTYGWGFYTISCGSNHAFITDHDRTLGIVPAPTLPPP